MDTREPEQARWFSDEVHPHESALRSYLHGSFPSLHDVDDVVQETYIRVWRSRSTQPIRSVKAFLFKVARHLALDWVRRDKSSLIDAVGDLSALEVMEDSRGNVVEIVNINEKVELLGKAISSLPARCREIIVLRKLKGLSQRTVAARLGISERTVEAQVARGVKRCEDYLSKRGVKQSDISSCG